MAGIKDPKQVARFIDYVIGRRPDEFGLVADAGGWIRSKDLLKVFSEEKDLPHVRMAHLNEIRLTLKDPPFELEASRIRSRCRDHLPSAVAVTAVPKLLYTAIRRRAWPHAAARGLACHGEEAPIVLTAETTLAERLGRRIDPEPVILTVHTAKPEAKTVSFRRYGECLYLAEALPATVLSGPPLPREAPAPAEKPPAPERPGPGSFFLDPDRGKHGPGTGREKGRKPRRERPPWRR